MLKLNKYLKELGYDENSFPFKDVIENTRLYKEGKHYDKRYVESEGFIDAECFSLDNTLSMIIYSFLCYFRDNCAIHVTPTRFCSKEINNYDYAHKKWLETIDDMILAFKLILTTDDNDMTKTKQRKINYGLRLFIKYYRCLWW